MTTSELLKQWRADGIISDSQFATLSALVRKDRFSLFLELNALLYLGVISLAGGLGWTFKTYFTNLGDGFILATLSALLAGSLYYCFSRALPYSNAEVESPNLAFDYVLYLGCLALSVELGYVEFRFEVLKAARDNYLLLATGVFFFLAYRFDNRFVLSLALSSLAGWFGLRFNRYGFVSADSLRVVGLTYGSIITAAAVWLRRVGIKKHFFEAYLHIAANVVFLSVLSGIKSDYEGAYTLLLLALATAAIALGLRFDRFAFVAYGTVYGYAGITSVVMKGYHDAAFTFGYFAVTGTAVIIALVMLARRFGRQE